MTKKERLESFDRGRGMPSEAANDVEVARLCRGKQKWIEHLLGVIHFGLSFEQWKTDAISYLRNRNTTGKDWDFILGGDDDMLDAYLMGEHATDYVNEQIDDASR